MKNRALKLSLTFMVAILSFVLGVATLFASKPVSASAETTDSAIVKVGDEYFGTLQAGINSAEEGTTEIILLVDSAENVIVSQVANKNIILNGNGKTYTGTIYIHGNARYTGAETLVIKNFNFATEKADHIFIYSNSTGSVERYAHNVTVADSTFTASGAAIDSAAALKIRQGFNIAIENVKSYDMHSVLQAYGNSGINVDGLTIEGGKNGISAGTSTSVVIENSTMNVTGYGVRADGEGAFDTTIENTIINAELPVVVRRASGAYKLTLSAGNTFNATNVYGYQAIFTLGDDGTYELATGNAQLIGAEDISVFGMTARIGGNYYANLKDAITEAEAGDVITLLTDVQTSETLTIANDKVITLNLNGYELVGTPIEAKAYAVIENKGELTITGNGSIVCNYTLAANMSYAVNTIVNSGKLVVDGAIIKNVSTAQTQIGYAIDNNSTSNDAIVEIVDGEIFAEGSYYYDGIRLFANSLVKENSVVIKGGKVSTIWMQNPSDGADRNTKDVKASISVEDGEIGVIYLEPSINFTASISGGIIGNVVYNEQAEGRNLTQFITGGIYSEEMPEEFWTPGHVVIPQNGVYVAMDMADFSVIIGEYLEETAAYMMEVKTYSPAGEEAFAKIISSACDEITTLSYMREVKRVVNSVEELFGKVLTEVEANELIVEYALNIKQYAEIKKVDVNDDRISVVLNKFLECGLKSDMQNVLLNTYFIIDVIAEENAQALSDAKEEAISSLIGANGENKNNVTSSMIASIYTASTLEEVEMAKAVATIELQEIILYKGYIKNASEKADKNAAELANLAVSLESLSQSTGIGFEKVLVQVQSAIDNLGKVKIDTEKLLATAVDKNQLQAELNEIEGKVDAIVGNITDYIDANVLTAIADYANETNGSIKTLTQAVATLEGTLSGKIDEVKAIVEAIKPLTKAEVEAIFAEGLEGLDGKVSDLAEKVAEDNELIKEALGKIETAITDYANETNASIETLTQAVATLEGTLDGQYDSKLASIEAAIKAIKPLTANDVENILASSDALDKKITTITNRIGQVEDNITTIVNGISDLIDEYKAEVDGIVDEVQNIVTNLETLSGTITSLKNIVEDAQKAADKAQQTANTAKEALAELSEKIAENTTSIEDLANIASQALEAAQKAEEAARLAMEKAQTAEVKTHATVTEQELKDWLDEYLASIGGNANEEKAGRSLIAYADSTTVIIPNTPSESTDAYREQLIKTLAEKYSEENAALVLSYYDVAIAQIAASASKEDINYALESFKANVTLVEYLDTLTPTPAYNDQTLVTLLIVIVVVEAIIAAVAIVLLIKVSKAKKQGGNDPDGNAPVEEVAVAVKTEAEEIVVEEPAITEQKVEEAPVEQSTEADVAEEDDENGFDRIRGNSKTFEEKLSEADEIIKEGYENIRAELLKYKKVNLRLSKKAVSFRNGRTLIAKMTIVGKTLRVYLALNPAAYETSKYFQRDVADKKSYAEVPMLMRVKSGRAIKKTVKLITDLAEKFSLVAKPEPKE